jgi:hypothetical protein
MSNDLTKELYKKDQDVRLRYYQGIKAKGEFTETFIAPPAHLIDPNIFTVQPNMGKY